jgi:glycosyltransferase involved in cell wall biosynthesis
MDVPYKIKAIWQGEIYDKNGTRRISSGLLFSLQVFGYLAENRHKYEFVLVSATPVFNVFAAWLALAFSETVLVVDWMEIWTLKKWVSYSGPFVGLTAFLLQKLALNLGTVRTVNSKFTMAKLPHNPIWKKKDVLLGLIDLAGPARAVSSKVQLELQGLFVGRHIPDKRLDLLPATLAIVREQFPTFRMIIVGDGPASGEVRDLFRTYSDGYLTIFPGRVSDEELNAFYESSSVFVFPSQREGFGLVVAESSSHGLPVVAIRHVDNAATQLIVDGVNGVIVPSQSSRELAEGILFVLRNAQAMRSSTIAWYAQESIDNGIEKSIDEICCVIRD